MPRLTHHDRIPPRFTIPRVGATVLLDERPFGVQQWRVVEHHQGGVFLIVEALAEPVGSSPTWSRRLSRRYDQVRTA